MEEGWNPPKYCNEIKSPVLIGLKKCTLRWLQLGSLWIFAFNRFPFKLKIVKIKSFSWTKLFTLHERAIKTQKNDTFPVLRRHTSRARDTTMKKVRCACVVHKVLVKQSKVLCNSSFYFFPCALYFYVFTLAYLRQKFSSFFFPSKEKYEDITDFKTPLSHFSQESATLLAIFTKMTPQWLRKGSRKKFKLLKYEHIIYSFEARDLEISNM